MSEAENTSKAGGFFKRVKAEFKRCTWPKRDELMRQSALVLAVSVVLGGDRRYRLADSNQPVDTGDHRQEQQKQRAPVRTGASIHLFLAMYIS